MVTLYPDESLAVMRGNERSLAVFMYDPSVV
jgi:hypothetical protein